jgi:hypothetical protein
MFPNISSVSFQSLIEFTFKEQAINLRVASHSSMTLLLHWARPWPDINSAHGRVSQEVSPISNPCRARVGTEDRLPAFNSLQIPSFYAIVKGSRRAPNKSAFTKSKLLMDLVKSNEGDSAFQANS